MALSPAWKNEKNFGKRVRLLREVKKLTQRDLTPFAVKQSYLANLETGRIENPSAEMIANIARGLGVKAEQLVAGTEFEATFRAAELPLRAYCPSNACKKLALNRYRTGMIIPYRFSIERRQASGKKVYEAKFCPFCGSDLLIACPSCKKPILIEDPEQTRCMHCGKHIFQELTKEQIDAIEQSQESP